MERHLSPLGTLVSVVSIVSVLKKPTPESEYLRGKTAKLLTLFRPATGEVRATATVMVAHTYLVSGDVTLTTEQSHHDSSPTICTTNSQAL